VKINGTHSSLLSVFTQTIDELKRLNIQSLGIPILSSLLDRLYRLDAKYSISSFIQAQTNNFLNYDKRLMCSEANRRATFQEWPHMDYKWVLPDSLAQAGFYHQPSQIGVGDDRTICFVCNLCLVAWEQSDQPWSEHERHSPICHFVRGEITENIPLSLTTSTQVPLQVFKNENVNILTNFF
jgi:baculoviral IAP repeat-containing protein 6 (apollon)